MILQILIIAGKDLKESLANRTILIVVLLPVIASLFFSLISGPVLEKNFTLGIVEEDGNLGRFIENNVKNFTLKEYDNLHRGKRAVEDGAIDCVIVTGGEQGGFTLFIDSQSPVTYLFLRQTLQELLLTYRNAKLPIDLEVNTVNSAPARASFLPVWITVTMTMIGILVISGNIAEEKDNGTMEALMISPINNINILLGKGLFGLILSLITVLIMCIINGVYPGNWLELLAFIVLIVTAGICFTSLGLLIGAYARSQSEARAIGTIIYLPLLFPALISDLSELTETLAKLFPTYYLYSGLENILYYRSDWVTIFILALFSLILFTGTYFAFQGLIKRNV